MTLRLVELFAGIGAQRRALENVGERENVQVETVGISEVDRYALRSYKAVFGDCPNLGDIRNIDQFPDCDICTYSFPCQSLSKTGRRDGMTKDSETESSLLWEVGRLVMSSETLPEWLVMENVPEVASIPNQRDLRTWVRLLAQYGYSSSYGILNAVDFGIPQNRARFFMVSHLHALAPSLPAGFPLTSCLRDYLETDVDEMYFLSEHRLKGILASTERQKDRGNGFEFSICDERGVSHTISTKERCRKTSTFIEVVDGDGTSRAYDGDGYNLQFVGRGGRARVQPQRSCTIPALCQMAGVVDGTRIRRLTPRECWRLMGRTDDEYDRASAVCSKNQLYKQAGNSIVVPVLEAIFSRILKSNGGQSTLSMFEEASA